MRFQSVYILHMYLLAALKLLYTVVSFYWSGPVKYSTLEHDFYKQYSTLEHEFYKFTTIIKVVA